MGEGREKVNVGRGTMEERVETSFPSSSGLNDLGGGGRLASGCGLGEGSDSHGGLVDTPIIDH